MKAIGMHIFAGGFTLGMRRHLDVLAHLEDGSYGAKTMRLNQPEIPVHTDPESWPLDRLFERGVEAVYGNPPCAPFSRNKSYAHCFDRHPLDDPRVESIRQMIKVLERHRPRFWVFESVCGAYRDGGTLLHRIERVAESIGHNVTHFLHDVNYFGVPQRRKRYFCIVHDAPIRWCAPEWEAAPTVGDVAEDIFLPEGARGGENTPDGWRWELWKDVLPHVKQGGRMRYVFEDMHPGVSKGRPLAMTVRIDPSEPTPVAMGPYRFIHPTEDRFLSSNEIGRLMGYPSDYKFVGCTADAETDLACRGVCVNMGDYLGQMIVEAAARGPETRGVMEVDFRDPPGSIKFVRAYR